MKINNKIIKFGSFKREQFFNGVRRKTKRENFEEESKESFSYVPVTKKYSLKYPYNFANHLLNRTLIYESRHFGKSTIEKIIGSSRDSNI